MAECSSSSNHPMEQPQTSLQVMKSEKVKVDGYLSTSDTILKAVPLQWPKLKIPENSTDEYFVPEGLVKLTIPPEKRDFLEYNIRIKIGDLVCVRYDIKEVECRAVYHLVVEDKYTGDQPSDDIEEENKDKLPLVVKMKCISRSSCQVSPRMADVLLKHQPTCELQVINLQESYK